MRKSVLHAEGRVCRVFNCTTKLSIYNPGKTCSAHLEAMSIKEARRCLMTEGTEADKAKCRRYKARVRAGAKVKHRVVVASISMDNAVNESIRRTKGGKR